MEDETGFNLRDSEYQKGVKQFTEDYERNKNDYIDAQRRKLLNVRNKSELNTHLDNISKNYDLKHKASLDKQISASEQFHFKDVGGSRELALQRSQAYEKQLKGEVPKLDSEFAKEKGKTETPKETEDSYNQRLLKRFNKRKNHDRSRGRND